MTITQSLFLAVALMFLIEGLMLFAVPLVWRETMKRLINFSDGQLRFIGFFMSVCGLTGLMGLMVFK